MHIASLNRNVHIYMSSFQHESRILRQTAALVGSGRFDRIYILATWEPPLPAIERIDRRRTVVRVRTRVSRGGRLRNVSAYGEWLLRCTGILLRLNPRCLNIHAVRTLPLAVVVRTLRKNCAFIYDTHEWETGTIGMTRVGRFFWSLMEGIAMPFVHSIVTVSDGIKLLYENRYPGKSVTTVRNFPLRRNSAWKKPRTLRQRYRLDPDEILFSYQGIIKKGRGIELLIKVFSQLHDKHIVFMGWGPQQYLVEAAAETYRNIHHHPEVSPDRVVEHTMNFDVGLCMSDPDCINHFYALPNKVLECLCAGVPVIVSDLPELRRIVEGGRYGWLTTTTAESLRELVCSLDQRAIQKKAAATRLWSDAYNWEAESSAYLGVFADVLDGKNRSFRIFR